MNLGDRVNRRDAETQRRGEGIFLLGSQEGRKLTTTARRARRFRRADGGKGTKIECGVGEFAARAGWGGLDFSVLAGVPVWAAKSVGLCLVPSD